MLPCPQAPFLPGYSPQDAMTVWLTAPGTGTSAAVEVSSVVTATVSHMRKQALKGLLLGCKFYLCAGVKIGIGFPLSALTTRKHEAQISIVKLLPCVCLCPSENLHCSKECHASPNEITAKP